MHSHTRWPWGHFTPKNMESLAKFKALAQVNLRNKLIVNLMTNSLLQKYEGKESKVYFIIKLLFIFSCADYILWHSLRFLHWGACRILTAFVLYTMEFYCSVFEGVYEVNNKQASSCTVIWPQKVMKTRYVTSTQWPILSGESTMA